MEVNLTLISPERNPTKGLSVKTRKIRLKRHEKTLDYARPGGARSCLDAQPTVHPRRITRTAVCGRAWPRTL